MKRIVNWFVCPPVTGSSSILLIRLMTGTISISDGLLKLVQTDHAEKFILPGFVFPATIKDFVAGILIIEGLFLIGGLFTRIVSFCVAIQLGITVIFAKLSVYPGTVPMIAPVVHPVGAWSVADEIKIAYMQILSYIFLLIEGPGRRSVDFIIFTSKKVYSMSEKYLHVAR